MSEAQYDHQAIEKKWQEKWFSDNLFRAPDDATAPKYYVLDMFPYPSGAGLHVGHPEGYTATDIISRYMRMKGYNVLHPMGWDAFGLPAENYAIKTQVHPEESTLKNITTFKRQIEELGFSYDWERELATCLPDYYKWTQWWFAFLYKNNLAYKKEAPVNWCDDCHTVLANEQVVNGKCERCKHEVVQKNLAQWFFKITDFIEDQGETAGLINGLDKIDWPESTKVGQRNWIGKSEGAEVDFVVKGTEEVLRVYTTRPDTLFGATYMVMSPEHPLLDQICTEEQKAAVAQYQEEAAKKSEVERMDDSKQKTGAFSGAYAVNPVNGKDIPIWVSDYVLMGYGTGAIMAVPAHDERDYAFAKAFDLDIIEVVQSPEDHDMAKEAYTGDGPLMNSGFLDGKNVEEAKAAMIHWLREEEKGHAKTQYKLRDWLVSRQRYWGAPIPMVFDDEGNEYLVPDDELPVLLPKDVDFNPTGESPLTQSKSFHDPADLMRIEEKLKATGKMPEDRTIIRRESDTMDTFVCSSWYMWRFMDPKNEEAMADPALMNQWGPIDLYVGGAEHTVLHLLYSRFFCKVLHKHGVISYDEPFQKLRHQGMILGEDGEKMSKSRGNVINPDDIIKAQGADTLRLYEMFMGPFKDMKPWSMAGVQGVYRFLQKVWRLGQSELTDAEPDQETLKLMHQTLKKVTEDIEEFKFNTAISQMMIFVNHLQKLEKLPKQALEMLLICLYPNAPHLTEEMWEALGHSEMIMQQSWPEYDAELAKDDMVNMPIQVNGKVRGTMDVAPDISEADALAQAKQIENVAKHLEGKDIVKELYVPGRIVNIVVK